MERYLFFQGLSIGGHVDAMRCVDVSCSVVLKFIQHGRSLKFSLKSASFVCSRHDVRICVYDCVFIHCHLVHSLGVNSIFPTSFRSFMMATMSDFNGMEDSPPSTTLTADSQTPSNGAAYQTRVCIQLVEGFCRLRG